MHSVFTGGEKAVASSREGAQFTAWDGYISGTNVEIFPHKKIVQKWRTAEFESSDEDSLIELTFVYKDNYTLLTLTHSNIPEGQGERYKKGWKDFYFIHMKKFFS